MKNIKDIIAELESHPDYLGGIVYTTTDMAENYNAEWNEDDEPFDKDFFSESDKDQARDAIEERMENISYDITPFPPLTNLPTFDDMICERKADVPPYSLNLPTVRQVIVDVINQYKRNTKIKQLLKND
jgi:hypothetical protein